MIRQPSAFIPVVMSLAALLTVLSHIAMFGTAREADEGTAAHIWQLLMAGQLPIIGFYVIKSLPQMPKEAVRILALQIGAACAAAAPVYWLKL